MLRPFLRGQTSYEETFMHYENDLELWRLRRDRLMRGLEDERQAHEAQKHARKPVVVTNARRMVQDVRAASTGLYRTILIGVRRAGPQREESS
jgi:hypothetical protein